MEGETIIHDTRMATVPRVGETITVRGMDRTETKYEALAVDYLLDLKKSISPVDELIGARIQVRSL